MKKILIKQVESVHFERRPSCLSFLLSQRKIHCCRSNYAKMADDVNIHGFEFHSCIIHFQNVKQSTSLISKARLNKVVSGRIRRREDGLMPRTVRACSRGAIIKFRTEVIKFRTEMASTTSATRATAKTLTQADHVAPKFWVLDIRT